jgi:hypothetical protein
MDVYSAGSAYAAKFHGQMALLGAKESTGDRTKWNMDVYSEGSAYAAKFHGQMALLGAKETRKLKALILHLVGAPGPMLDVRATKATWIMCLVHTQCSASIDHLLFVWLHFQWRSFTTTEYVYSIGW